MAEDKQCFVAGRFLNGSVPDNHTLRCADAGDVRIYLVSFLAGLHQKHTIAGNRDAGSLRKRFDGAHQLWMLLLKRLKVIKERIDEPGADEKEEQQNWQCREPKIKPPAQ